MIEGKQSGAYPLFKDTTLYIIYSLVYSMYRDEELYGRNKHMYNKTALENITKLINSYGYYFIVDSSVMSFLYLPYFGDLN